METKIAKAVRAFRAELATHNSTFFIIYSDFDLETNQVKVKVTTNSTVEGVSSILGMFLEPTDAAVNAMAACLQHYSSIDTQPGDCETLAREALIAACKLLKLRDITPPSSAIQS